MFKRFVIHIVPVILMSIIMLTCMVLISPLSAQTWSFSDVVTVSNDCTGSSVALDNNGSPVIMTYYPKYGGNTRLWYSHLVNNQWQTELVADVGAGINNGPGLAIDANNNIHVAFLNTANQCAYALYNGTTWSIELVDAGDMSTCFMDLVLDNNGNPHIAYPGSSSQALKYAKKVNGLWQTQQLTTGTNAGRATRILMDSQDHPHILGGPKYLHFDGTQWLEEQPSISGVHSSLTLDDQDRPQICYYLAANGQYSLWFATRNSGNWEYTCVDPGVQQDKRGWDAQIRTAPDGVLHIIYFCHNVQIIRHAWGGGDNWQTETITNDVGMWDSCIDFVISGSSMHISYYNGNTGNIRYGYAAIPIAPLNPTNLSAQIMNVNDVQLSWDAPIPIPQFPVTGYRIYVNGAEFANVTPDSLQYLVVGLGNGNQIFYITALSNQTESDPSNSVEAVITLLPPEEFATQLFGSDVHCSWQTPAQTNNITSYNVYRNGVEIGQTANNSFTDYDVQLGTYTYWATAIYNLVHESASSNSSVISIVSNSDPGLPELPTMLYGNFPNPFNPSTVISYSLACDSEHRIEIYNLKGERIRILVKGAGNAGMHLIAWDGRDDKDRGVASGLYLMYLKTDHHVSSGKLILQK